MQISKERYDAMVARLKESNHRITPQRLAIVRILAENDSHPSVESICTRLRGAFPSMSQATVYRNIMLLKSLGEVYEIGLAGEGSHYDGRKPYPHPHIVCLTCGKIIDPDLDSLHDMTKEITDESGFEIVSYRLDFFGVCPECRTKS